MLGKSALAQLTPHDFGAIIFLSYLAFHTIPVSGALLSRYACNYMFTFNPYKIKPIQQTKSFYSRHPIILIKHGDIIFENLQK